MNFNPGPKRGASPKAKPKDTKYTLKRLWDYLYSYKWLIIIAFVLTLSTNLFALVGPYLSGLTITEIDAGENSINFEKVYFLCMLMVVFYSLSSILSYILSMVMIKVSKNIVYKMRKDAFDTIEELPVAYFDNNTIGDIISKMSYDIDTVNTSLSSDLINIITSAITIIISLIMMIIISPILVLVFVVTIPISLLFANYMIKKTRPMFRNRSKKLGELNGYVEEMITSVKTIQAYGKEDEVVDKFDQFNYEATESSYKAEFHSAVTGPGVNFVNNLSFSLICLFGALLNAVSDFNLGKISSFILYSRKFSGPINEIANIITELQSALAAAERVFSLIDAKREEADKETDIILENVKGDIGFNDVTFGYNENKNVLTNINFKVDSKQTVAIVGPTGSGKTTIVNLLMRFYDIKYGQILMDNININDIKRFDVRSKYSMVLQDTWLFEGSVLENLTYGKESATIDEVRRICRIIGIDTIIEKLPNKYDTILTEGGSSISKGQKQLLTIARAMLLDSKMLILDEATSNVDTHTDMLLQNAINNLLQNKTCFIIAHRLSTIENADIILVVKDGKIVERGSHLELLKNNGFYAELYYSQFE